jgi:hypothetical protein
MTDNKKMGRPALGDMPMTPAQRQKINGCCLKHGYGNCRGCAWRCNRFNYSCIGLYITACRSIHLLPFCRSNRRDIILITVCLVF